MSIKIEVNSLYFKDENDNFLPAGMIATGADKTLKEIKAYADEVQSSTETEIKNFADQNKDEVTQKGAETLASIPEDYTSLTNNFNNLSKNVDGMGLSVADGALCITFEEE